MNNTLKKMTLLTTAALVLVSAMGVSAQAVTPTPPDTTTATTPRDLRHADRLEEVAEALGITVEELQAKLDSGQTVRDIAEELGVDLSTLFPLNERGERIEEVAEALGITVEELQALHDEGKTLEQIAAELGVDLATVLPNYTERMTALAEALGITVEELQAQLAAGSTPHDIAEELGVELPEHPQGPRGGGDGQFPGNGGPGNGGPGNGGPGNGGPGNGGPRGPRGGN